MAALQYVHVPGYAALILRRTFPELQGAGGLLHRSREWLANTDAEWNEQQKTWTFPSGATLRFGHVATEGEMFKYDGQEYQFIGFDELTHFTEAIYDHIGFTRARRNQGMLDIGVPIRTRATAMPIGVGYGWVRERFVVNRKRGVPFVPAKVWDNPGLDVQEYAANSLSHLPQELREKLLNGDWDVFIGAAYQLSEQAHFVEPMQAPAHWHRFESMDHGVSAPTAWYLWTTDTQGNHVILDEYYEVRDTVAKHAAGIKLKREEGWQRKDDNGWPITNAVFGDPSIANKTGMQRKLGDPASVLTEYNDCGLGISLANHDRRAGFARLRELLNLNPERPFPEWHPLYGQTGAPKLYVVASKCPNLAKQLRSAPLQPNDKKDGGEIVDPDWESGQGHAHAAVRYGAMGRLGPSPEPENIPDDPREARMLELRRSLDVTDEEPTDQFLTAV